MSTDRRDRLAFDRWDHHGLVGILWLVALGAVAAFVIPVVQWIAGSPIRATVHTDVAAPALSSRTSSEGLAAIEVAIADPTPMERLLAAMPLLLTALAAVWVVWLLLRLISDLRSGVPFTDANVRRLDTIALVIGLGAVVVAVAGSVRDVALTSAALPSEAAVGFELSMPVFPWLTAMFVLGAISQAFRHGVRLRADVDGLV